MTLTADPGYTSSIPAQSHTFVKIGHGIISTVILLLLHVQEVLVNSLVKLAKKKVWLGELTVET